MSVEIAAIERAFLEVAGELGLSVKPGSPIDLDSLERAEIALALEERLGVELPPDLFFHTVPEAARAIGAAIGLGDQPPALEPGIGHLQWAVQSLLNRPLERYFRVEVSGQEHVPVSGPAVLAVNHESLLDIPVLAMACPRYVLFMAKAELFAGRFASVFFHALGGFPVHRGGFDLRAIRAGVEVLEQGRLLVMFPEGTRGRALGPFLPGPAWLTLARGAPLIPVGITGSGAAMPKGGRVPRRSRVRVRFGEPMPVEREDDPRARLERAREITSELRARVERLLAS